MAEEKEGNGKQPYVIWKIPFLGMEVKFGGRELFSVIVLILLATPIIYVLILHDQKMLDHMQAQVDATEAFTYVITLPQAERQKLNLAKPKRIRELEQEEREFRRGR